MAAEWFPEEYATRLTVSINPDHWSLGSRLEGLRWAVCFCFGGYGSFEETFRICGQNRCIRCVPKGPSVTKPAKGPVPDRPARPVRPKRSMLTLADVLPVLLRPSPAPDRLPAPLPRAWWGGTQKGEVTPHSAEKSGRGVCTPLPLPSLRCPLLSQRALPLPRHRLDMRVGGPVVVAKTQAANAAIQSGPPCGPRASPVWGGGLARPASSDVGGFGPEPTLPRGL